MIVRGDGDDQHRLGLYGGFLPWIESLTSFLTLKFPLPPGLTLNFESNKVPSPRYRLIFGQPSTPLLAPLSTSTSSKPTSFDENHPYYAHVLENTRITAEDWTQDVRHVALSVPSILDDSIASNEASVGQSAMKVEGNSSGVLKWYPGDVVYMKPQNFPEDVSKVLKRWNLTGEEWLVGVTRLDAEAPEIRLTEAMKVRDFLASMLDISGVPRRYFFELLAYFASEEIQAEKLRFLASAEGQEELHDYARRAKRSFLDVLDDFDSAHPPLDYLLDLFPKLQPRAFSISSSQNFNPSQLTISMVVVRYRTPTHRLRRGVCSTWISNMVAHSNLTSPSSATSTSNSSQIIPIWIKRGTMTLPTELNTPIIMVGPGTGCAIFRAFIQERINIIRHHQQAGTPIQLAPAFFYFGCRHEMKDFLYEHLWIQALEIGALTQLTAAFSQDRRAVKYFYRSPSTDHQSPSDGTQTLNKVDYPISNNLSRVYVQNCIKEDANPLWNLIHNHKASIFVCGNANKMPNDVRNAFITVAIQSGQMEDVEAEKYVRGMEATRRYCVESWS